MLLDRCARSQVFAAGLDSRRSEPLRHDLIAFRERLPDHMAAPAQGCAASMQVPDGARGAVAPQARRTKWIASLSAWRTRCNELRVDLRYRLPRERFALTLRSKPPRLAGSARQKQSRNLKSARRKIKSVATWPAL